MTKQFLIWLILAFTSCLSASALAKSAPENSVWEIFSIEYDAPVNEVTDLVDRTKTSTSNYDRAPIYRATTEARPTETNRTFFSQTAELKAAETGATNGAEYEAAINDMFYGGQASRDARSFSGAAGDRIADNVVAMGDTQVAIESKFVNPSTGWEGSIYNPANPFGSRIGAPGGVLSQAQDYSNVFDQVIYHSNSQEFIDHMF